MFTGLIEEMGTVVEMERGVRSAQISISVPSVHIGSKIGDSMAVDGCCLTIIAVNEDTLQFEAVPETLDRTSLGKLRSGDLVNMERPLAADARLGGHFVQGHIDGVGVISKLTPEENALIMEIEAPEKLLRYIVEKGSIAVDGVSLTAAAVSKGSFTVWLIPHTLSVTTLGIRCTGSNVNLECDILGKYVEKFLQSGEFSKGETRV